MQHQTSVSAALQQFLAKWTSEVTTAMNNNHSLVLQRLRLSIPSAHPHSSLQPSTIQPFKFSPNSPRRLTFATPSAIDQEPFENKRISIQPRIRNISQVGRINLKTPQNKIPKIDRCNQSCKGFQVTVQRNKRRSRKEGPTDEIELQNQAIKSKNEVEIDTKAHNSPQLTENKMEIRSKQKQSPTRESIRSIFKDMLAMKQGYPEAPLRIATNKLANALQAQGI